MTVPPASLTTVAPRLRRTAVGLVLAVLAAACADAGSGSADEADGAGGVGATGAVCEAPPSDVAFDLVTGLGALPPATLPDLAEPDVLVCTSDWVGTPTVVNFWATWCVFCVEEMPDLQAAHEALGDRVRLVGVDVQDVRDDALAFLDETGVTYPSVTDADQGWYEQLGNRGMPTTLFVDDRGTVVWRHTGPITREQVLELVEEHLGVAV